MKTPIAFLFVLMMSVSVLLTTNVYSSDLGIGVQLWGAWWDPMFKNAISHEGEPDTWDNKYNFDTPYAFMIGPMLSLKINDRLSLSGVYMFCVTSYEASGEYHQDHPTLGSNVFLKSRVDLERSDLDLLLNYSLGSYFKVFFGVKRQVFDVSGSYTVWDSSNNLIEPGSINVEWEGIGAGAGFGLTIPVGDNIFLLLNFSGLITKFDYKEQAGGDVAFGDYYAYGGNVTMNLAFIKSDRVTIFTGLRYQHLVYDYQDGTKTQFDKEQDKFAGITLAAVYSLDMGSESK